MNEFYTSVSEYMLSHSIRRPPPINRLYYYSSHSHISLHDGTDPKIDIFLMSFTIASVKFSSFSSHILEWKIYFWRDNGKTLNAINFLQEFLSLTIWIPSVCFRIFVVCIRTTIFSSFYICHKSSKYYFVWFSSLQRFFFII